MNPSVLSRTAIAAAVFVASSTLAFADTATTDPVGFMTVNVAAGTGTNAALTFSGLGLTRPIEYQGSAETANTTTLIDDQAPSGYGITVSASSPYYVEIASGTAAGTTYDIASISGTTINLVQSLAGSVTAGVTFKVRKHWTLGTAFGVPPALTGGAATTADTISIYSGSGYLTYYYKTSGIGGTGWRSTTNTTIDEQHKVIYPDDGLIISHKAATTVPVVVTGAVKTGQSSYPVLTGLNVVTNPCAASMTLASSTIYNGNNATGLAGGTATTADTLSIWNGNGYTTYYYKTSGLGGNGWRSTTNTTVDEAGASIPAGAAIIVKRNGAAFNWVIPQHPPSL